MRWDRALWGVLFYGSRPGEAPLLLGCGWERTWLPRYAQEPPRALTFTTRAAARHWCRQQHAKYVGRPDCCAQWRFRPVRVREVIQVQG